MLKLFILMVFVWLGFDAGLTRAMAIDADDALQQETLTIGRATRDVAREERRWRRLLAVMNQERGDSRVPKLDLRTTNSTAGILWDLWDGNTQVFIGDPFVAASFIREMNAVPLFVIEEVEPSSQRAVIVVRESGTNSDLAELNGRLLAFTRYGASLVHLLPHSTLLRRGYKVAESKIDLPRSGDRVDVFHLHDDRGPLMWLYRSGLYDGAAAMSMMDFERVERIRPELFRPVLVSRSIPLTVAITSATVDTATRRLLSEHLQDASAELFDAIGISDGHGARFRAVTPDDPAIVDLVDRLRIVEAAGGRQR